MAESPSSTSGGEAAGGGAAGAAAPGHLSIGEVLALLLEEFPDITISKIRFLESQGLIDPERTASGYRKFYGDDVELLRCILREQRENYLPLRVIKDRLDSGEIDPTNENPRPKGIKNVSEPSDVPEPAKHPSAGGIASAASDETTTRSPSNDPIPTGAAALFMRTDAPPDATDTAGDHDVAPPPTSTPDAPDAPAATEPAAPAAAAPEVRAATERSTSSRSTSSSTPASALPGLMLSADELCAMAGLSTAELGDLESYGVLAPDASGDGTSYDEDALDIATCAKRFMEAGVDARHLRGWRVAAEREAGLLEQLIQPLLRQRNPEARAQAVTTLNDLDALGGRLRAAMMRSALRHHTSH